MKTFKWLPVLAIVIPSLLAGQQTRNINQLLGYPADTKLLIIHADDMGLSHSTNAAVIEAFESRSITSGSIMTPCPWAAEIATYIKEHPGLDVGIHFTTNAEWKYYKCGGILSPLEIPTLVDNDGHFYPTIQQVAMSAKPDEVEKELRAQIEWALAHGIQPTHLDSHMGSMYVTPDIFNVAIRVAREYQLPVSIPVNTLKTAAPFLMPEIKSDMVGVDHFIMLSGDDVHGDWNTMYAEMINSLIPGLNELVVHLSYDNDEMKAIAIDHESFGSAWRNKDLNVVTSNEFKKLLSDNKVRLVTWKQIQEAVYPK